MELSARSLENRLGRVRDLESRFTYRMSMLCKTLDLEASELLRGTPVTLTAYNVLIVVETFDQISISDISRFNVMDRAQVSRTANDLGRRGYVSFSDDPHSKRKKMVSITQKGKDLLEELLPSFEKRRAALEEKLGPEGFSALWIGMDRLHEVLNNKS
ncbi:MAG: MarR family transcriptional regulator [Pseudomonadota bacterium]